MQQAAEIQQDPVMEQIAHLQQEWAHIKYQIADDQTQSYELKKLGDEAAKVTQMYPDRAEPKIWQGIILSTKAGIDGGLGALGTVKEAKALFEAALKQNPRALDGSAYTSLGSLYYQVPGWPIGFGDDEEAEKNLKQALQINPDGIDPNFFYADFLIEEDRYDQAKTYLNRALQAPDRPERPMADAGRRQEIKAALAKINGKSNNKQASHNN
ncbi:MAG: tetratricopeptide repeat protein [Alphaproteobacteria bacterium]